jgi:hypothetical protein
MIRAVTLLFLWLSVIHAEDALLPGGLSPDERYQIRIYQTDSSDSSDYYYGVYNTKSNALLKKLDEGGGYSRYSSAKEISKVFWHPSSRFFALTDHGTRHSMEMYIYEITSDNKIILIGQPDYFQNALGRVNSTEAYMTAVVKPINWKEDSLTCNLFFDAKTPESPRSMFSVDFILRLRHGAQQRSGVEFTWMGTPKNKE